MWHDIYLGARSLGISDAVFWRSSPRELAWHSDAARARHRRRHKERIESAWLVAALMRQKPLPDLSSLIEEKPVRRQQTWQEMKATLKVITGHA